MNIMHELMKDSIIVLVTALLSMGGYWLMIGGSYTTEDKVKQMIGDNQKFLQLELDQLIEGRKEMAVALNKNTEAITDLKIAIAKLASNDKR